MALLINKIPWTQQPQVPVGIDWSNPITRGMSLCVDKERINVISGKATTVVGTKYTTGLKGIASGFGATFGAGATDSITTDLTAHATYRTYLSVATRNGLGGGSGGRLFEKRTAGAVVEAWYSNAGGSTLDFWKQYSGATSLLTVPAPANNKPFALAIAIDSTAPGSYPSCYKDGVKVTVSGSTSSGTVTTNADAYVIGNRTNDNARNWDGEIYLTVFWDRLLSETELASVTANPWQIFQPLQRRIFVPIPSGGLAAIFSDNLDYYSIRGLIDSSVNPNYNIRTFTQTDKSSVFNVRTNTAIDNSVTYVLRNLVQTNAASGYNVRGNASLDASANYKIRTTSDNTNVASYSIRSIVDNINNTSYNLRGSISSDKSSAFNVRGLAANSLGIVYNLRGSAYSDSLNNYTILSASSVSAAVTAVYNLRNLVNNTTSSSFNINSSVAQSILDEYKVRTSSLSSNSNNYNIRSNVLKDVITNYQINPAVQYVYSDLNCYYNIITSMISPNEVARVKIYPSRLITTYDVERVKRIIA